MVFKKINELLEDRKKRKEQEEHEIKQVDSHQEAEEIRIAEDLKKDADRLVNLKQYKVAIDEYHKALAQYPQKEPAFQKARDFLFAVHSGIAHSHHSLHQYKEAVESLDEAINLHNLEAEFKAHALFEKGSYLQQAHHSLEEIKSRHKKEITVEKEFTETEKKREQLEKLADKIDLIKESHACFLQAVELMPHNADFWYAKGHMEVLQGHIKQALHSFDQVLTIQEHYHNKHKVELFDEIKREKGIRIVDTEGPAYKAKTGHLVKDRAEALIANFLFEQELLFQYNVALPWHPDVLHANFYVPKLDLYIEHFGKLDDSMFEKINSYKNNSKSVIYTTLEDEKKMEEILKAKMKPYLLKEA